MQIGEFIKTHRSFTAVLGAAVVLAVVVWQLWLPPQLGTAGNSSFVIPQGWGGGRIASELHTAGLIRSVTAFIIYTNLTGTGDQLKAGTYLLSPSMSVPQIVDIIAGGKGLSDDIEVTIPEGVNIWEINKILLAAKLPMISGYEGYLFPETYRFAKDTTATQIEQKMTDEFQVRASGYSAQQVIIASIIEKEAKSADDMAMVSGIIAKRTARGMPLQVDASVGYGWCVRVVRPGKLCDVTQAPIAKEIKVDGPYNTYTRTGLPVGPIANPGLQALNAATHPKDSPYVFYLSTRDGSQLIYAKTLDEHLKNRLKYLGF